MSKINSWHLLEHSSRSIALQASSFANGAGELRKLYFTIPFQGLTNL